MSNFRKCDICHEFHWKDATCKPMFFVYHEDYLGDDYKTVRAYNHEDAACNYAKYYNESGDYALMNETIEIKVEKGDVIKYFKVGAEPDIYYSSEEIEK